MPRGERDASPDPESRPEQVEERRRDLQGEGHTHEGPDEPIEPGSREATEHEATSVRHFVRIGSRACGAQRVDKHCGQGESEHRDQDDQARRAIRVHEESSLRGRVSNTLMARGQRNISGSRFSSRVSSMRSPRWRSTFRTR